MDLSSLLYDHRLVDASQNSSDILQSTIFTEQYVNFIRSRQSPTGYSAFIPSTVKPCLEIRKEHFTRFLVISLLHVYPFFGIILSIIWLDRYVERVLSAERDKMKCCSIEYTHPKQSSQAFVYGGILLAGFLVYSLVIFFSSPVR